MLLYWLQPLPKVTMSLMASLLSGYNIIGERRVKEKCKEQRIGKIKSIGWFTVWKFTSHTTFVSKAKFCRTSSFGEHSLPVLLPSHKQRNGPFEKRLLNVQCSKNYETLMFLCSVGIFFQQGTVLFGRIWERKKKYLMKQINELLVHKLSIFKIVLA